MAKTNTINAPRVGDYLHLVVPANRHLAPGTYRARIESLVTKHRYRDGTRCHCCIVVGEGDYDDPDVFTVHFQVTLFRGSHGLAFLGQDQFPVTVTHEQNLERRLRDSLPYERLPYRDE